MKEVLVTIPVQEEHRRYLEEIGKGMHFTYAYRKEGASREMVWRADYILGNVKPEYLPQAEKLQFLQLDSAGQMSMSVRAFFRQELSCVMLRGLMVLALQSIWLELYLH